MTLAGSARVFVKVDRGPRVSRLVKELSAIRGHPDEAHPGSAHDWHALLHYETQDSPMAECICGAIGAVQ